MGTAPAPRTFQAGEIETAAYMNSLASVLSFLLNPPRCSLYHSAGQTLVSGTALALAWDSEQWDTDGMHSTTTNNTRITATTAGQYLVVGTANFGTGGASTGFRQLQIMRNANSTQCYLNVPASPGSSVLVVSHIVQMNAGDYVELLAEQTSGANQTLASGTVYTTFQACWVGNP